MMMKTMTMDIVQECGCVSSVDWSLNESDVTPCQYDVTSLPWQRDADDESLVTTLKRAMIPTVVESERVTDDDDVRDVSPPAVAGARQHDDVTVTRCHRPLSVVHQRTAFTRYLLSFFTSFLHDDAPYPFRAEVI